jgi:hypothetical protein
MFDAVFHCLKIAQGAAAGYFPPELSEWLVVDAERGGKSFLIARGRRGEAVDQRAE